MKRIFTLWLTAAAMVACSEDEPPPQPKVITITTSALPAAQAGDNYSAEIAAEGGSGAGFRWSVSQGALPAGLFLASSGTPKTALGGIPSSDGDYTFTIKVTDSEGTTTEKELSIAVAAAPAALAITAANLPAAFAGRAYTAMVTAQDGSGSGYQWSIASGTLPAGLTITEEGTPSATISGTPTQDGSFNFTVRVRDSEGNRADRPFSIVVMDTSLPLELITEILPGATEGVAYSAQVAARNGAGVGYRWSLISGALPPGLTLAAEGTPATTISGTPTQNGSFTFSLEVTDGEGGRDRTSFTIDVARPPPPLRISTVSLPDGTQGTAYSAQITGINGTRLGYAWTITAGALPPGLTMAAMGTPSTTISGVPTTPGVFNFTVRVTDSSGASEERAFEVEIARRIIPISIVGAQPTPIDLGRVVAGDSISRMFTAQDGTPPYNWVLRGGPPGLLLQLKGTPSTTLGGVAGAEGTFTATITVYDLNNVTASQAVRLTVDPPPLPVIVTTTLIPAESCNYTALTVTATRGSGIGYQWSVSAGNLPPGLSIEPTGTPSTRIVGRPTVAAQGTYNFTVRLEDSAGGVDTQALSITINAAAPRPQRWGALLGDIYVDNDIEVSLVDLGGPTPGVPFRVNPVLAGADAVTAVDDLQFSPDGRWFAFKGDFGTDGTIELWVVDLTRPTIETAVRVNGPLVASGAVLNFKWSPDGRWLAYHADQNVDADNELFVVDMCAGLNPGPSMRANAPLVALGDVELDDYFFSPDSRKLAYVADQTIDGQLEVFVIDLSSGAPSAAVQASPVFSNASMDVDDNVQWTPDSTRLLMRADPVVLDQEELFLVDVSGPAPWTPQLVSGAMATGGDVVLDDYAISPNGQRLFFIADRETDNITQLWTVEIGGPTINAPVLASAPNTATTLSIFEAKWSPDSTRILYVGDQAVDAINEIYLVTVAPTASAPVQLNPALAADRDVSTTASEFDFISNGRVLYISDQDTNDVLELFLVDVSGPSPAAPVKINQPGLPSTADVDEWWVSPDGSRIVYIVDPDAAGRNDLWMTTLDAGGMPGTAVRLNNTLPSGGLVSQTRGDVLFTRNSSAVAFVSDMVVDNDTEAWAVAFTPGGPTPPLRLNPTLPANADVNRIALQP